MDSETIDTIFKKNVQSNRLVHADIYACMSKSSQ